MWDKEGERLHGKPKRTGEGEKKAESREESKISGGKRDKGNEERSEISNGNERR